MGPGYIYKIYDGDFGMMGMDIYTCMECHWGHYEVIPHL